MDEVFCRNRRIDRDRLAMLNARSDAPGSVRLAAQAGILLATGLVVGGTLGTWWVVPATALHGAVLVSLFAPLHETIHRTAFKTRWLNDAVAAVCGAVLLLPAHYFRFFHFAHHRWTQDPVNDPELALPKPATIREWIIHVSGWNYWRAQVVGTVLHALGRAPERFITAGNAPIVIREARLLLLVYAGITVAAIAAGSSAPLIYWIVPALVGQPLLRLYLLAEHTGCPFIAEMLANSRTTLTNEVVRFFAWNMPYHAEHHAFPSVPFHALPELHRSLAPDLKVVAKGYVAVHRQILRGF